MDEFLYSYISEEQRAFLEKQTNTLVDTVNDKVEKHKKKLEEKWLRIRPIVDVKMEYMASKGYAGFELYKSMYLGHPTLLTYFLVMASEIMSTGKYSLHYDPDKYTLFVTFNRIFIKEETLVLAGGNGQLRNTIYTIEQERSKKYKKFKRELVQKHKEIDRLIKDVEDLKKKLNEVYYAPGMPGYRSCKRSFSSMCN